MRKKRLFSPAEWEVLQYITEHHPITAREVADYFAQTQGRARTTVLTLMERLREKGYLTRRKEGPVHRYAPSEPASDLLRGLVREFVQKALGGSVSPFMAYLAEDAELSPAELAELKRLVHDLEKDEEADDA